MAEEHVQRRLDAILAADVAGYSRLMGEDEAGTRARFNARLNELIEPTIASHRGRLLANLTGSYSGEEITDNGQPRYSSC